MQRFAALGLDVAVTELDDRMPAAGQRRQPDPAGHRLRHRGQRLPGRLPLRRASPSGASATPTRGSRAPSPATARRPCTTTTTSPSRRTTPRSTALGGTSTPPPTTSADARPRHDVPADHAPPTTPPDRTAGSACTVADAVNAWNTGLTANITITNTGTSTRQRLVPGLHPAPGQTVTSGWNATITPHQRAGHRDATSATTAPWPPGGSTTIGFQATHTGNAAAPTSFTLNGSTCSVG